MPNQTPDSGENSSFVVVNADGSYIRLISVPCSPPTPDPDSDTPVLSKDLPINDINKTGVRIYLPKEIITATRTPVEKLPLIVYYHGGGFVITTAASTITHEFCDQLAACLRVVVVSVNYRNAPEHRLPAAYDDGVEALHWVKSTKDPWLTNFADFSNCYLMGTSAGANLVYHAALRVSQHLTDLEPLSIKGLILHNLFVGGVARTESEVQLANVGSNFNQSKSDDMWDLALPVGATRDHEYCNLMMGCLDYMGRIKDAGWRVMMAIRYGDLMIDRQVEIAKTLELKGVECTSFFGAGEHGAEYFDKAKAKELYEEISRFMYLVNGTK